MLPLATFAASVYVTNRLNNESELTVMLATGSGPWRLARPVFLYGVIAALMMSILNHVLVPTAQAQLSEREGEISRNITSRLLTEGAFLNPTPGVTFYTRTIGDDGVLRDVFLSDRRNPLEEVMYTAAEAYLVRNGAGTSLIMVDGLAQRLSTQTTRLSTAKFQDFSFDITTLVSISEVRSTSIRHMPSFAFAADWDQISADSGARKGEIAEALHSRFAQALFCIVAAMIGFSALLIGGFSRFGVWREIVIAFVLLIFVDGIKNTIIAPVYANAALWPLIYLPVLIGLCIVTLMLMHASHPNWWRRRVST